MAEQGFSIAGVIRKWATETPDAPALTYQDQSLTWKQLLDRSAQVANALAADGVGAQDRVAFLDKNDVPYFEVLFGGGMINAVNVAVNWRLAAPEISGVINDAEARILFVSVEYLDVLEAFESDLQTVKKIIILGPAGAHETHEDYETWLSRHPADDPGVEPSVDDVAMQLYTSGTTGLPKGVMLSNRNLTMLTENAHLLQIEKGVVNMVGMPLFHIGGSGWALFGMTNGAHSVLVREFDPKAVLDLIPQHKVSHAFLVPAALLFMTLTPGVEEVDYSSLKVIAYGASPISEDLLETCMRIFGCDFYQVYGLTETTGAVTMLDPDDHRDEANRERLRSAGRPMGDVEIRIIDAETGKDAEPGDVGEIWIRSAQIMKGYWKNEAETNKAVEDGWFKSGDAGYLKDGYLFLYDRVKDMIVSGGENVYPAEVENALMKHPAVADVAVIGVPSERWGEEVKAIVVKAEGQDAEPADLIAFCREQLAGYKVPKSVDFAEALPRNPSGKVLKKDLRAPYWEGKERQVG